MRYLLVAVMIIVVSVMVVGCQSEKPVTPGKAGTAVNAADAAKKVEDAANVAKDAVKDAAATAAKKVEDAATAAGAETAAAAAATTAVPAQ